MPRHSTLSLILPAFGAALIAVLSQIVIPIGAVPFSLQTLGVGLCATLFKPREAVLSIGLYILLGAIGLPVFAGGSAGFSILFGPTAGFIWGFLLYAALASSLIQPKSPIWKIFVVNVLGDGLVLFCGILSLHFLANLGWQASLFAGVIPFILPDFGKVLLITFISKPILSSSKTTTYFK